MKPDGCAHPVVLAILPAEGPPETHDVDGICADCGETGFPVHIAPVICAECGGEVDHHGYGSCEKGCSDLFAQANYNELLGRLHPLTPDEE